MGCEMRRYEPLSHISHPISHIPYLTSHISHHGRRTTLPVTKDEFRRVLSHWASGIAVITTRCDGGIHGMTASSFCSLSLDPPLILVSIAKSARTHGFIAAQRAFGVHFLGEGQEAFSDRCAGRSGNDSELLEGV